MDTLAYDSLQDHGSVKNDTQDDLMFTVELIDSCDLDSHHYSLLDDLMRCAIEPNLYYESWVLKPAVTNYRGECGPYFLIVYSESMVAGNKVMCGFIPLSVNKRYKGQPLGNITLWHYPHCSLATPIIHRDFISQCVSELSRCFAQNRNESLVIFNLLSANQLFAEPFIEQLRGKCLRVYRKEYRRAYLNKSENFEAYIAKRLPAKIRRENRRRQKKLAAIGNLCWDLYEGISVKERDLDTRIDSFLSLEASGWKGGAETALKSSEAHERFFRDLVLAAAKRSCLKILSLKIDGKPIAMMVLFVAYRGAHIFKMAYDESYRSYAPGVILNIELIRRFHDWDDIDWIDTCTAHDNDFLNTLFPDRLSLCNILVAKRYSIGSLVLRALPALSRIKADISRFAARK